MQNISSPKKLISVIIPCFKDEKALSYLLKELKDQSFQDFDCIVSDGAMSLECQELCQQMQVNYIQSSKGRGQQMNAAADISQSTLFLFLHCDSKLQNIHFLRDIANYWLENRQHIKKGKLFVGHCRLEFYDYHPSIENKILYHSLKSELNRVDSSNGDQAMLISKNDFQLAGGFWTQLPFLEDYDFYSRNSKDIDLHLLPANIGTSARRLNEGAQQVFFTMTLLTAFYHAKIHYFSKHLNYIYPEPDKKTKISYEKIFRLLRRLFIADLYCGLKFHKLYKIARFINQNTWQAMLILDFKLAKNKKQVKLRYYPSYRFWRYLVENPISNSISAIFIVFLYLLILPFCLKDQNN